MSNKQRKSSFLPFFFGALIGSAIGAAIAILMAPKSGTETRYQLSENMDDAQHKTKQMLDEAKLNIEKSIDKATKNLETTVKRVTEAFNAGRKAAQENLDQEEDTLTSVRAEETKNSGDNTTSKGD